MSQDFVVKAIKYGMVGILATVAYAALGLFLTYTGSPLFLAHTIALVVSLGLSYIGQKVFTYGIRKDHRRVGTRFVIATTLIVVGQYALVYSLNLARLSDSLTILISTIYYPPTSFLVHTFWTFTKQKG
ncbi:MAG: GtrA family protein [Planctomycetota bacterium]